MNILFLGDIVGQAGRDIVFQYLKQLQTEYAIDFTIVNAENSAHGKGISFKIYERLLSEGVNAITMGNHSFSKKEIIPYLGKMQDMVVPYNHLENLHQGYKIYDVLGQKLCVINLLGTALMHPNRLDPFSSLSEILDKTRADLYFVDFHAEATSEKRLMAEYFKDRLIALVGTHTHVQTADERIIGNLAFISDVGMCGVYDSIIGRDINEMINASIKHEKTRYEIAKGPAMLSACVIQVDQVLKKATGIQRIQIRPY